jgi:hypothetical protein
VLVARILAKAMEVVKDSIEGYEYHYQFSGKKPLQIRSVAACPRKNYEENNFRSAFVGNLPHEQKFWACRQTRRPAPCQSVPAYGNKSTHKSVLVSVDH